MRFLLVLWGLGCSGAGGGGSDDYHTGDFYVRATVDGAAYEGDSQGVVWTDDGQGFTQLMLWPADPVMGYLFGWEPGDTGTYDLVFAEDVALTEGYLLYQPEAGVSYVSASGTLEITSWEEHEPDNAADDRLGFISGTFESTVEGYMGATGTVSVTAGEFMSQVAQ